MVIKLEDINPGGIPEYFVGDRKRLACATSVKLLDASRLLVGNLAGRRLYLVRYDLAAGSHQIVSSVATQFAGQPVITDLVDFDGREFIVTSNCESASVSMYRLADDELSFLKDFRIPHPQAGFCHGVKFLPPGDVICATCTTPFPQVFFLCAKTGALLHHFGDGAWKPKDICFLGGDRMLVLYSFGLPTPSKGTVYSSKVRLMKFDLTAKTHAVLDEIVTEEAHVDCVAHADGRVFVNNQMRDLLFEFRLTGDRLTFVREHGGYHFPHGVDILPAADMLAVTNYGDNTLVLKKLPPPPPKCKSVLAVVAHYRCEQWLAQCIQSLVNQTRPPDNIVVIDDASPTPPVEILKKFPQVTLLAVEKNVGQYRLLQAIFDCADYDAYMMQDADDWSTPDRLELLLAAAERTGAELIGCQSEDHFEGIVPERPKTYPADPKSILAANPYEHPVLLGTSVFTRDLIQRLGGLATAMRHGGDSEFIRRAVFAAHVTNIPQRCYHRRIHPNASTRHPKTGYNTPARMAEAIPIRERSKQNFAADARGEIPDLAPFAVAEPVALKHICGPHLREKIRPAQLTVPSRKPPVFIAGMHRSGTSLTANLLRQCGLWLGEEKDLHGATPTNPDGHWESLAITELNDALLNELGGGWDNVPAFPAAWPAKFPALRERAKEIHAALARPTPWGWKDPRVSLLMPFWLALEPAARVVICVRHPLEVAHSSRSRGAMSYTLGLKLWRDYNERLLAAVPRERRIVVHYEDFFTQPLKTIKRLAEFCGLGTSDDELARIAAIARPELRHARFGAEHLAKTAVSPEIIALYAQLCSEAGFAGEPNPVPKNTSGSSRQIDLDALAYEMFLQRWRVLVYKHTPAGARIAVVSKGDNELLRLHQREVWHFPRDEQGRYAGYHPADDGEALAQLAAAQAAGAQFLALPAPSMWWLDCYPEFHRHLEKHFTRLETSRQTGLLYDLRRSGENP